MSIADKENIISSNNLLIAENQQKVYEKGYEQGKAEGGEFIGIKYLEVTDNEYKLPVIVDARSLSIQDDKKEIDIRNHFASLFANAANNWYMGQYTRMRDVYLPNNLTKIHQNMFSNCISLKNIYGDLTNCTSVSYQGFLNCTSLTEIPYMPNLGSIAGMAFRNCTALTSITFYKVLTSWANNAFQDCTNITEINLVDGWNTSIYAQHCPKLTSECVDNMISCLADMTGLDAPTIQFHADVKEKLTEEQIATITGKNWTLP